MFVCIEFTEDVDYYNGDITRFVNNVYGPFPTLEAAEEFRSKHKYPEDCDCYLLQDPEESS